MGGAIISFPRQGRVQKNQVFTTNAWVEMVAAQGAGAKIQVQSLVVSANAAVDVTFGTDEVAVFGPFYFAAKGGMVLPYNPYGYFETVANESFDVFLSAAQSVSVGIVYVVTT